MLAPLDIGDRVEVDPGIARNTIKKYLREGIVEPAFQTQDRPSKLDPYAAQLTGWLVSDQRKSRKDRRTAKLMHADLVKLGYEGSHERVAAFVREWKSERQRAYHTTAHGIGTDVERRAKVADLLAEVGLSPDAASRYPHEFSGGQRQRIGIARALALDPEFIVADECVSALDVSIQAQVLNLLMELRERRGLTMLFIAHDLSVVEYLCDQIAVMYLGRIVEVGPAAQVYHAPRHPYTRALLSAIPQPDPRNRKVREILPGDIPSPLAPPSGCVFRTRCRLADEDCATAFPDAVSVGAGHVAHCIKTKEAA